MAPRRKKSPQKWPFSSLSDDLLVVILSKIAESGDRKSFSEVCKKWYNVEGESRRSLCFDAQSHNYRRPLLCLSKLALRFPNLTHLTMREVSNGDLKTIAETCKNLGYISLFNFDVHLGRNGLAALGHGLLCIKSLLLSDVETVALGCRTLEPECVLVDKSRMEDPTWSSQLMHIDTRRVINFFDSKIHNMHQLRLGSSLPYNLL